MAKTIPKLTIDTEALHSVRKKLRMLSKDDKPVIPLSWEERNVLLELIAAGKRSLYPTKMSIDRYLYHLDQVEKVDPITDPNQFDHFTEKIRAFQEKYCK